MILKVEMKVDPDGCKLIILFSVSALLLGGWYYISHWQVVYGLALIFCLLSIFSLYFFRDPERKEPEEKDAAVSAADGVVVDVSIVESEGFEGNRALRIAVLMNVFNVHVNRCPLAGEAVGIKYRAGKKLSVYNKRAGLENEHGDTEFKTAYGRVMVRQIAGIIARRVVTRVKKGDILNRGDRLGIVRFGSRVDVFLPTSFVPAVSNGEHVFAGETVIARLSPVRGDSGQ